MRIGKVAKHADITVEAVRFYEKTGLIDPPQRNESGYRDYPEAAVQQVLFIRRAKELGFSLKEVRELMSLHSLPGTTCHEVKEQAVRKMQDIDQKVKDLLAIKGPLSRCPIMDSISNIKNNE